MRVDDRLDDEELKAILGHNDQPHREIAAVQAVLARRLVAALNAHGDALATAAKASDEYARRLVWATWALVLASVVLVVVTWVKG